MTTLVIRTDNMSNAKKLSAMLKDVKYVKSVNVFNEPALSGSDWIKPGRAATDEEVKKLVEKMLREEKEGVSFTPQEAKRHSSKLIRKWKNKQ